MELSSRPGSEGKYLTMPGELRMKFKKKMLDKRSDLFEFFSEKNKDYSDFLKDRDGLHSPVGLTRETKNMIVAIQHREIIKKKKKKIKLGRKQRKK